MAGFEASVDAEIYEIFVEEINEILDNFKQWVPEWAGRREDTELLREIRRAYHTCKGSGRMLGGLALGDYAWAHEDMLNQVLEGGLPRNDNLATLLKQSVSYLDEHLSFFLSAEQGNEGSRDEIDRVEAFIQNPDSPLTDSLSQKTQVITDASAPSIPDEPLIAAGPVPETDVPVSEPDAVMPVIVAEQLPESAEGSVAEPEPEMMVEPLPEEDESISEIMAFIETLPEDVDEPESDQPASEITFEPLSDVESSMAELDQAEPVVIAEPEVFIEPLPEEDESISEIMAFIETLPEAADGGQPDDSVESFIASLEPVAPPVNVPDETPVAEVQEQTPVGTNENETPLEEAQEQTPVDATEFEPVGFNSVDDSEELRIVWEMFREELPDQLLAIDKQMQNLTADPGSAGVLQELERELHTLKGGARMAQLTAMGDAAHEAEELLESVRRERGRVITEAELVKLQGDIDQISVLAEEHALSGLSGNQLIEEEVVLAEVTEAPIAQSPEGEETEKRRPEVAKEQVYNSYLEQVLSEQTKTLPDLSVLEGIDALSVNYDTSKETASVASSLALQDQEQVRLSAAYLDKMVESSNAMNIKQNAIRERLALMSEDVGEFGRTASRLKQLLRSLELETETQVHAGYRNSGGSHRQNLGFDPLEMDEYSEIQRLSRALAESLNDLVNIEGDLTTHLRTADKFVNESAQTGRELHQSLLTTRLVEVSAITPRLRRIMRQVAAEFGRKVSFEIDGEALKLDRYLLQRMTAPLEHILRNAAFHGIELPQERIDSGKDPEGGILLEVEREDTEVVFRVTDDGRGLDKEKIRAKAIDQGLIDFGEQLSEQDVYKLVLRSGFTTVTEANQVAGRGVGMDVVNSEIKALGGSLLIDSSVGSGSEFTVRLPFTMAANPVLFVAIQKQQYALPLGGIQGLTRLTVDAVKQHLGKADSPLVLGEQPYVLHYLGDALGHPGRLELREGDMHVVIYMHIGGHYVAWLVDAINGRHEVVLQSLGALFNTCRFYSAATVTSDGDVIMVPDMLELAEQALARPVEEVGSLAGDEFTAPPVRHEHPHILIVDDSITVRKVTEKLLVNENFVVDTAKDGLEALEKLVVFEADLILLDIEMPRMDGFEVLRAVRNEPGWKDLPVIMISSRTAEKHLSHARELGASDFLGKPYQNQDLLEHIFRHLNDYQPVTTDKPQVSKELA